MAVSLNLTSLNDTVRPLAGTNLLGQLTIFWDNLIAVSDPPILCHYQYIRNGLRGLDALTSSRSCQLAVGSLPSR